MKNTRYVLDTKTSQLTVQAFAEGLAGIADHRPQFSVREFSLELEFDTDNPDGSWLRLMAKTGSLEIIDEVSQLERKAIERVMFGDVLHPQRYPEVVFVSSKVVCMRMDENHYRAEVMGTTILHGNEHVQTMQAQIILSDRTLRAHGDFRLRQSDYGLAIASVAGGTLRIKDELKFVFFFLARKEAETAVGAAATRV
jgi:polyisoprenoid-binding protein YceI